MDTQIRDRMIDFVVENFLFGDASRMPADEESLVETGTIDSTGILELIEFLESTFAIQVEETETVPENLGSVANVVKFVAGKRLGHGSDR